MNRAVNLKSTGAKAIAKRFFALYQQHNTAAMIDLFEPGGIVEYVPFNLSGPVEEVGPGSWGVLVDAFPDLNNRVHSVVTDNTDRIAHIDVNIAGTQIKEAFGVANLNRGYDVRHFFIMQVNSDGKIVHLTSFWDNAQWFRQLGKTELAA